MKRILTYICLIVLVCSCGLEEMHIVPDNSSEIEFTSSRMRIITKAGDDAQKFDEGTRFRLFAVQNGTDWSQGGIKFYNQEGVSDADGGIEYSIDGKKASYDVGKNLDFYGLTYGSAGMDVEVEGSAGTAPVVNLALADNQFPDLMYSSNLKNKNSASGLLHMEFRHTLAKLKFEVLKQNEAEDTEKQLENVVLTRVVLKGSAHKAAFNAKTGEWTTTQTNDRSVFESVEGMKVEASAQRLQNGGKDIEMLVVPNNEELYLEITVDVDGDTGTADQKTVEYKLMASETDILKLVQNHEYTLSIVVLKNDVRIVTVTPKVYDWIDVEMGEVAYFGQPVYFGGLMWMDRNLGAQSADCENDWYHSVGYYYQHGRNIPYIFDVDTYLAAPVSSFSFIKNGYEDTDQDLVFTLKVIYTHDNHGNRVTTVKNANHSSGSCLYGNVAINPGDPGDYSFVRGYIYLNGSSYVLNSSSWAKQNLDFLNSSDAVDVGSFNNNTFWHNVENQPCPKGWRLPGKSDMYSFMPESTKLYWLDGYKSGDPLNRGIDTNLDGKITTDDDNQANYASGNKNAANEVYEWKYFAGKFKIDPSADKSAEYSYPITDKNGNGRVYGIKYEGEDKAYRVMFEQRASSYSSRKYVRISRFEATSEDRFKISPDDEQWNIHQFDWTNPVESMDIPLAGFMYENGLSDFGSGTILRAVEGDGNGKNWTMYLRSGHNGIAVGGNSRRLLGDQIRCVRDINAK